MRSLRRIRGPWRDGPGIVSSLLPLVIVSLWAALFITQSGATLAQSSFQSPLSPVQTPPPVAAPTEVEPGPPEEQPVTPPFESPIVPGAEESPGVPQGEGPGEATTPSAEAGATPGAPTSSAPERGGSSLNRGLSLAVLIDTAVVALASLWLCCGGLALVFFVLVVIASFVLRVT